jgi:hypothetical protein
MGTVIDSCILWVCSKFPFCYSDHDTAPRLFRSPTNVFVLVSIPCASCLPAVCICILVSPADAAFTSAAATHSLSDSGKTNAELDALLAQCEWLIQHHMAAEAAAAAAPAPKSSSTTGAVTGAGTAAGTAAAGASGKPSVTL